MTEPMIVYVVMVGDGIVGEVLRVFTSIEKMQQIMPRNWQFNGAFGQWAARLDDGGELWVEEIVLDD